MTTSYPLCGSGVAGLDEVLSGGFPRGHVYLIQGEPGTGKTTLGMQFLLEGARQLERVLYITFSETRQELSTIAESHGWDIGRVHLLELSAIEPQIRPESLNTLFHPAEIELNQITKIMLDEIERVKPLRVVFDSVSEMRMLSEVSSRFRRVMLALKQRLTQSEVTVLLLDDLTTSPRELQIQSIVHGVVYLQMVPMEFGTERRRVTITKMRGVRFRGGYHDMVIKKGGIEVFPRMVAGEHYRAFERGVISSGIDALDRLLGGGLDRGTSNLLMGPAGSGKSTIALQYAVAAAHRGEPVAVYSFEESVEVMLLRCDAIGLDVRGQMDRGNLAVTNIDTAEVSPGELTQRIRRSVEHEGVRMVVIDSLNGYIHAMPQEQSLLLQLHELLSYLNRQGVVTLIVLAQQGLMGPMQTPVDVTYLADSTIITRYFEARGAVHKAISVVKKRSGPHEDTIRELNIGDGGVRVGEPLEHFRGVMTGVPVYTGTADAILAVRPDADR